MTLFPAYVAAAAALVAEAESHGGSSASLTTPDFAITISTWVTFLLFAFFLARFGWKPFVKALDEREAKIADDVKRAEAARSQAEELLSQYNARIEAAKSESDAILAGARQRSEEIAARLKNEAQASAQALIEKAKTTIEGERQKAVTELRGIVAGAAVELAAKILEEEIDGKRHEKLVDRAVAGIGAAPKA